MNSAALGLQPPTGGIALRMCFLGSGSVLRETTEVKYAMMAKHAAQFGVQMMCRVMLVSPSGYYDWCRRVPSAQAQARTQQRLHSTFDYLSPEQFELSRVA